MILTGKQLKGGGITRNSAGQPVAFEGTFRQERPVLATGEPEKLMCSCERARLEGYGVMCMFCEGPTYSKHPYATDSDIL